MHQVGIEEAIFQVAVSIDIELISCSSNFLSDLSMTPAIAEQKLLSNLGVRLSRGLVDTVGSGSTTLRLYSPFYLSKLQRLLLIF